MGHATLSCTHPKYGIGNNLPNTSLIVVDLFP